MPYLLLYYFSVSSTSAHSLNSSKISQDCSWFPTLLILISITSPQFQPDIDDPHICICSQTFFLSSNLILKEIKIFLSQREAQRISLKHISNTSLAALSSAEVE